MALPLAPLLPLALCHGALTSAHLHAPSHVQPSALTLRHHSIPLARAGGHAVRMSECEQWSRRSAASLAAAAACAAASPANVLPAFAASEYDGSWTQHEGPFDEQFFKDFTTTPTGFVYKKINNPDTEKPVPFQKVFVHYTGYLLDGTKFDSSYDREPFSFRLGKGKVITGWEATVGGMTVGQKVIVKIPPQYAYGDKKTGPIPANSDLLFYIELLKLGGIKGDKPRLPGDQQ